MAEMKRHFDFLTDYLYFTFSILQKASAIVSKSYLWYFLEPLDFKVWLLVLLSTVMMAVTQAILSHLSSDKTYDDFLENLFTAFGCLFLGWTLTPSSCRSARIMQVVWWLFTLLFFIIYIASFAAQRIGHGITSDASGFQVRPNILKFVLIVIHHSQRI